MRPGSIILIEEYIARSVGMRYFLVLERYQTVKEATSYEVVFFTYAILHYCALYIDVTLTYIYKEINK